MFSVLSTDLDADGRSELIVVDHVGTSNGMAMTWDRISIIDGVERPNPSWVRLTVAEFGDGAGTFVRRAGQPGNWILSTEWERSSTLDPQRGAGTYLVGRWFSYAKGRLVADPGVVVRRLLNGFADERSRDVLNQPHSFFLGGKGRAVDRDPGLGSGEVLSTLNGRIAGVRDDSYELAISDGRKIRAAFDVPYGQNADERIDHVGLTSLNRVLPKGVAPTALGVDVIGRSIRLVRYKDGKDTDKRVLWVD